MRIFSKLLLLGYLFAALGCQLNPANERAPRLSRWIPAARSTKTEVDETADVKNSIVVSGLVNNPGLQSFESESITLRKAVAAAGDISYFGLSKSAIFVAVERPLENGIVSHFIPADLLNHPSVRDIQLAPSDSVRVMTFEKTTLAYSTEKLETVDLAGKVVPFVEIAVSGIGEPVRVLSDNTRAPKLEKLGAAIEDYKTDRQLPPILLLSRELPSQSRREIYYLPTSSDLYGVISDRPEFLDLTTVFQKGVRLRNGDVAGYSFLQSSPIVVENLFTKVVTENESTANENRTSIFTRQRRAGRPVSPFNLPRLR